MKKYIQIVLFFSILFSYSIQAQIRSVVLLDTDWMFFNSQAKDAEKINFDDSAWQKVTVPHDWAINGPFDMNLDAQLVKVTEDGDKSEKLRTGRTGALPMFGVGWYRRVLQMSNSDSKKRIFIEFDGAMSMSKIYVNGNYVGEWPYGYSSFSFEITDFVKFGEKNILAVRLENKPESSRWYAGAGIFRNVRLVKTSTVHVKHWGTFITTPSISAKNAVVNIKTTVLGESVSKSEIKLVTDIYDANAVKIKTVVTKNKNASIVQFNQNLDIKNPKLWSPESPVLYKAISNVYVNNQLQDTYTTNFGCRSIRFDKDKGFFLNEIPTKIKGVCLHHDLGPLGAAVNMRATVRQLEIMKEMGCNSIRTSHNPPSPEQLQACDSLGLMVMVEAFDEWKIGKNKNGYNVYFDQWAEKDLRAMIQRDRNHPSVIIWSIGNEIREQGSNKGKEVAQSLADICRNEDPTRPITAGLNNHNAAIKNGLTDVIDLVGFNYKPHDYVEKHNQYPDFVIYGSETSSTVSSRGEYKFPVVENKSPWYDDYQVSSYDLEYPSWATTPDKEFEQQDDCDFVFGEYVWTGFDYLGEPTPYNEGTPARSSYFGIVDLAGLKKDRFYLYQSKWSDAKVLHLLPHWNWPERIGQNVPVYCYSNYPKVELFVNGKSMGVKQKDTTNKYSRYRLMWSDVIYQPGEIKVVAYDANDKAAEESVIKTAGAAHTIKLTADRTQINADGKDLSFVTIEILDKDGNFCPRADNMLFFNVSGAGNLKALCNGNAIDQTSFASNYMRVFNGKTVAIIESTKQAGDIVLNVSGGKLNNKELIVIAK